MIKDLGNGALHTNGGDITHQENATVETLDLISVAFEELLEAAYERPAELKTRKAALKETAAKMRK